MDYSKMKGVEIQPVGQQQDLLFNLKLRVTTALEHGAWRVKAVIVDPEIKRPIGRPYREGITRQQELKLTRASERVERQFYEISAIDSFLQDQLAPGPKWSNEIFKEAAEFGWTRKKVYEMAKVMNLKKTPRGQGGNQKWYWSLTNGNSTADVV